MISELTASPKLYIGIDIHKKTWSVSMRTDLFDHKTFSIPPDSHNLFHYVESHFRYHEVHVTYEACCCGFVAARDFLNFGWRVTVVNPADVPTSDKHHYQKTDSIDSRHLCKQLSLGNLRPIYIRTEQEDLLRSLLTQRDQITKQLRKVKSHIKSFLLLHGIQVPEEYDNSNWSKGFISWLKCLEWTHSTGLISLQSKLRSLEFHHKEYLLIGNELRAYCRKYHKKDYYLLKSIPGIGGFLSAAIIAELGDIRRFQNESQLASYIGIIPGIRQSGNSETKLGITPRSRELLRSYLIEAAWIAIRKDPEIQSYYRKHAHKNPKSVIVKVAHKMVRRILSIIKQEKTYEINTNQKD